MHLKAVVLKEVHEVVLVQIQDLWKRVCVCVSVQSGGGAHSNGIAVTAAEVDQIQHIYMQLARNTQRHTHTTSLTSSARCLHVPGMHSCNSLT